MVEPKSLVRGTPQYPFRVSTETNPPQTEEIVRAIADAFAETEDGPDPWWQAGLDEALEE